VSIGDGSSGTALPRCNLCWSEFKDADDEGIATRCGHLFCLECANRVFGEMEGICPVRDCEAALTSAGCYSQIMVNLGPGDDFCKMVLAGYGRDVVLEAARSALWFADRQADCQRKEHVRRVAEGMRDKVAQMHAAYKKAKEKAGELSARNATLEGDFKELQEKFEDKSREKRKLQEMYDKACAGVGDGLAGQHHYDYDPRAHAAGPPAQARHPGSRRPSMPSTAQALGSMGAPPGPKERRAQQPPPTGGFERQHVQRVVSTSHQQTIQYSALDMSSGGGWGGRQPSGRPGSAQYRTPPSPGNVFGLRSPAGRSPLQHLNSGSGPLQPPPQRQQPQQKHGRTSSFFKPQGHGR